MEGGEFLPSVWSAEFRFVSVSANFGQAPGRGLPHSMGPGTEACAEGLDRRGESRGQVPTRRGWLV